MTAKTTQSKKSKGRRLQKKIVELILSKFKSLTKDDIWSRPMGCSGTDIVLSAAAAKVFPYEIEAKNTEKLNIWDAINQSQQENRNPDRIPMVVFKKNGQEIYCCLKFNHFMNLLKGD